MLTLSLQLFSAMYCRRPRALNKRWTLMSITVSIPTNTEPLWDHKIYLHTISSKTIRHSRWQVWHHNIYPMWVLGMWLWSHRRPTPVRPDTLQRQQQQQRRMYFLRAMTTKMVINYKANTMQRRKNTKPTRRSNMCHLIM